MKNKKNMKNKCEIITFKMQKNTKIHEQQTFNTKKVLQKVLQILKNNNTRSKIIPDQNLNLPKE